MSHREKQLAFIPESANRHFGSIGVSEKNEIIQRPGTCAVNVIRREFRVESLPYLERLEEN